MGRKAQSHGDGMRDEGEQRVDVWLDLREEKEEYGGLAFLAQQFPAHTTTHRLMCAFIHKLGQKQHLLSLC